jgi:hypothetical protein
VKIEHRITFSQGEMHRLAEEAEYALVVQMLEKLPDIQSQRYFIDAYHQQISELKGRVHAYVQGFGAVRQRFGAEISVTPDGWQLRFTPSADPQAQALTYATERDRAGVLRDCGDSSLHTQSFEDGGEEVGMALSILAEALDDVSDALCRQVQEVE